MSSIRAERDYVIHEDFMKAVRKLNEAKKLESSSHYNADFDCVEEIDAQRMFGYALFKDGKHTQLAYPLEKFHSDVAGRSFHNGHFIQRMREKAASLARRFLLFQMAKWQAI
ncbi:squalene monooxygenase SE1-like [Euphorbia lathyris]|uniref:squalene monooxygenase SE1-like n=1 Tax=Euphorbia lathyris TaxID=212925 RepID=UPI003313C54C